MKLDEFVQGNPIRVERSRRGDNVRALTSAQAGKIVPLAYFPLLREDAIRRGQVSVTVRMAETVHPLINAVNVRAYAHLVPFSAFERFSGMDDFNEKYSGKTAGFFRNVQTLVNSDIMKTLGIHLRTGTDHNAMAVEAYNTIVNWRRAARSKHLSPRSVLEGTLARAFWSHPILWDVVPDYEQALIDGDIPLELIGDGNVPLHSYDANKIAGSNKYLPQGYDNNVLPDGSAADFVWSDKDADGKGIWVSLANEGFKLSLSNIELAKQTVAFAKLRQQYQGIDDDTLIDLLMDAIRVPPEALRQPILLGRASSIVAMTERHAMDGDNLDMSRTVGTAALSMRLRCPPVNTGGVVLITCEITPEPLFERLGDKFLMTTDPTTLPQFLRDYLDPKKVEIVDNWEVDTAHGTPDGIFGYRGLNRGWDRDFTLAGGKFLRPGNDAFDEDRQRFWVVESNDPSLTEDFYLVSGDLENTPFADRLADPFEILTVSHQEIEGNTVFGKQLHEDTGDYEAIVDRVTESEDP